jgi:hypothetical protein
MRFGLRLIRRCTVLALACWLVAAPVTVFAQNAAACRHQAMHQSMHGSGPSKTPCWCGDMTGNTALLAPEAPALPSLGATIPSHTAPVSAWLAPRSDSPPASPSYTPTPPPPNGPRS